MSENLTLEDLQNIDFDEDALASDRSGYRNYSKSIAITIGYLLGVKEDFLKTIPNDEEEYYKIEEKISKNESAKIIRSLNNIRTNLMLRFKEVSRRIRISSPDYSPIDRIDFFEEDFKFLRKSGLEIVTGRSDLVEYLKIINDEIFKRLDNVKSLFPEWVDFKHIKNAFNMPSGSIEEEKSKFQLNQNFYPYKRYFYWKMPVELGNILLSDEKILNVLYKNDGAYFTENDKVIDVSDRVKDNINEFIRIGRKIQIFIDGENTDPYRFCAAIDSLSDEELDKIDKIVVYYDAKYSTHAWKMLKHFVYGIDIETIAVERLLDEKSLVDHKLVAGVSKAVYRDDVDSIILCSSDSDFWAVIEDVDAKYLVMAETDKCGYDFKEVLRQNNIFYCYLDRFKVPSDNKFFKIVFRKELQNKIDEELKKIDLNAYGLLESALKESRAFISKQERENVYNRYILGLKTAIDKEGNISLEVPE